MDDGKLGEAEMDFAVLILSWLCSEGLLGTLTMRRCLCALPRLRVDQGSDWAIRRSVNKDDR